MLGDSFYDWRLEGDQSSSQSSYADLNWLDILRGTGKVLRKCHESVYAKDAGEAAFAPWMEPPEKKVEWRADVLKAYDQAVGDRKPLIVKFQATGATQGAGPEGPPRHEVLESCRQGCICRSQPRKGYGRSRPQQAVENRRLPDSCRHERQRGPAQRQRARGRAPTGRQVHGSARKASAYRHHDGTGRPDVYTTNRRQLEVIGI